MRWKTLKSEYLIRRPWLTARRDAVQLPTGVINDEFYVLEYPDWINVIAITKDGKMVMEHLAAATVDQEDFPLLAFGIKPKGQLSALMVRGHEALMSLDYTVMACKPGHVGVMDIVREELFRRSEDRAAICSFICHCYSPCNSL